MLERVVPDFERIRAEINQIAPAGFTLCLDVMGVFPELIESDFPDGWQQLYAESRFAFFDPILYWATMNTGYRRWSEITIGSLEATASRVMKRAREFDLIYGAISVRRSNRKFRKSFLSVSRSDRELTDTELERIDDLLGQTMAGLGQNGRLSEEELTTLREIALGRTQEDIAEHLGISKETVKKRLERARQKLGANNAAHAVAIATASGIISLPGMFGRKGPM